MPNWCANNGISNRLSHRLPNKLPYCIAERGTDEDADEDADENTHGFSDDEDAHGLTNVSRRLHGRRDLGVCSHQLSLFVR